MTVVRTDAELPDLAAPAPRNQVLIGTVLAGVAAAMLVGGLLAVWVLLRARTIDAGERFPLKYDVPQGAANLMFVTIWLAVFFALFAWRMGLRDDRGNTGLGMAVVAVLGIAFINAQGFAWFTMEVPIAADYYGPLFYTVTGAMVAVVVGGLVYTVVALFSALTGRVSGSGALAGHLVYWLFAAVAYTAVWSVVYVAK